MTLLTIKIQRRPKHRTPMILSPAHDTIVTSTSRHARWIVDTPHLSRCCCTGSDNFKFYYFHHNIFFLTKSSYL